jgi:hypothetical protein
MVDGVVCERRCSLILNTEWRRCLARSSQNELADQDRRACDYGRAGDSDLVYESLYSGYVCFPQTDNPPSDSAIETPYCAVERNAGAALCGECVDSCEVGV